MAVFEVECRDCAVRKYGPNITVLLFLTNNISRGDLNLQNCS